jgi:hypothetical protein
MGIAKYLKAGRIFINTSAKQIEIADKQLILPYHLLKDTDWGLVYEKFVGQILESEGFEVTYNGLEKGLLDRGIDLIASKDNQLNFIQCKYTIKPISKSRIDWILYNASSLLFEKHKLLKKKISLHLL